MTTESENITKVEESGRPVIDDDVLDRLMGQVDAGGLELLGPDGVLTELTSRILDPVGVVDMRVGEGGHRLIGAMPAHPELCRRRRDRVAVDIDDSTPRFSGV